MRPVVIGVALAATLWIGGATAQEARPRPLAPLDGFAGCWRGAFQGAPAMTDERCFAPMLDGRYVRDTHTVRGGPMPYAGESVFAWDPGSQRIAYAYYASDGGMSRGFADATGDGLAFPADRYVGADGRVLNLRASWRRDGPDRFVTITEIERDGAWRPFMRIDYTRAPAP